MDWFQVCALCACVCGLASGTPPPGYIKQPDTDQHPPRYEFGYDLKDGYGGSSGHLEARDGEYALGKYYVSLPSNEQKVDYFADDWGYHPLVEYKTSSASSSMSSQFALGERAVAALSKQYGVAPPLEILKTKVAQSLVAGTGPQVTIQGATGLIPGPSDEPVHNSLEAETYSSTTTTSSPPHVEVSVTPGSLRYESTSSVSGQHVLGGVEVSSVQPAGVQSATYKYSSSGADSGEYRESADQNTFYQSVSSGPTGYFNGDNYRALGVRNEEYSKAQVDFASQKGSYSQSSGSNAAHNGGSSAYESVSGETLPEPTKYVNGENYRTEVREEDYSQTQENFASQKGSYYQTSGPAATYSEGSSGYETASGQTEHSSSEEQNGHQVVSYLADTNSAIDVTSAVSPQRITGGSGYSPNTHISAVLVGEGESKYQENEIRQEYKNGYVSSTTEKPSKTVLKPIVVSESEGPGSLSLFSSRGSTKSHTSKGGKLYHREGRLKPLAGHGTTSTSDLEDSSDQEYDPTPAPTPEPVLVTPRQEASLLTSSGNILAPIQAGVSISHHHNAADCDEKPGYEKEDLPSSGPDIEKQVIEKTAVYKTTVDIQKSIPFEIHPNEESSPSAAGQYNFNGEGNLDSQGEYQESDREHHKGSSGEYSQSVSGGYSQSALSNQEIGNGEYQQSTSGVYSTGSSAEYNQHQDGYEPHSQDEVQQQGHAQYQSQAVQQIHYPQPGYQPQDNGRNNFIQQVAYAYHRMANNPNKQHSNEVEYPVGTQVSPHPIIVPNRLYYVYLQRYNPFTNRYGDQSQLYTNYRPPAYPAQGPVQGSFGPSKPSPESPQAQAYNQEYHAAGSNYNVNGNGYAAVINHDQERSEGLYKSSEANGNFAGDSRTLYHAGGVEGLHAGQGVGGVQAASLAQYATAGKYEQASPEYATQNEQGRVPSVHSANQYEQASQEYAGQYEQGRVASVHSANQDEQASQEYAGQYEQGRVASVHSANQHEQASQEYAGQYEQGRVASVHSANQDEQASQEYAGQYEQGRVASVHSANQHEQASQEYAGQYEQGRVALVHSPNQHEQSTGHGQDQTSYLSDDNSARSQEQYSEDVGNDVNHQSSILDLKGIAGPQYYERTKLVELEKPVHIPYPVPVEYTKVTEKQVPVAYPVPVQQTKYVDRPVPVPQPVPLEVTRVVEQPVPVPQPVPVEYTRVVAVEKPVLVSQPVPYAVTKLVAVDRPVAYPQPVPLPYAVPHPVGVPVPHLVPYPQVVPVPVKGYRPVYVYRKPTGGRLLHREVAVHTHTQQSKQNAFRPSQPVFASQYPPQTYHVTEYFRSPHSKARGHGRKLCIEYGGFKPPLVPSTQVDEERQPKPEYGPPAEDKH